VLELEGANFPVIFDVWCQVVEHCAGPPEDIRELVLKLEDDLLKNLTSGKWPGSLFSLVYCIYIQYSLLFLY
jgi:hypothetical protein